MNFSNHLYLGLHDIIFSTSLYLVRDSLNIIATSRFLRTRSKHPYIYALSKMHFHIFMDYKKQEPLYIPCWFIQVWGMTWLDEERTKYQCFGSCWSRVLGERVLVIVRNLKLLEVKGILSNLMLSLVIHACLYVVRVITFFSFSMNYRKKHPIYI